MAGTALLKEYAIPVGILAAGILLGAGSATSAALLLDRMVASAVPSGFLVLALLPPLQAGMGFNFGLGLGAWAAQAGFLVVAANGLSGAAGTGLALALGLLLAACVGGLLGWLLSRMAGLEMMTTLVLPPLVMPVLWLLTWGLGARLAAPAFHPPARFLEPQWVDLRPFQHSLGAGARLGQVTLPLGALALLALAGLAVLGFRKYLAPANPGGPGPGQVPPRQKVRAFALSLMLACAGQLVAMQDLPGMMTHLVLPVAVYPSIPALIAGGALLHRAGLRHACLGMVAWNLLYVPLGELDRTWIVRVLLSTGLVLYALMRKGPPENKDRQPPAGMDREAAGMASSSTWKGAGAV